MSEYKCARHGGWLDRRDGYRCARCDAEGKPTRRERVGPKVRVHFSLKEIVITLLLLTGVLWFKGAAIEQALRHYELTSAADVVRTLRGYLRDQAEELEDDAQQGAEQRKRDVSEAAKRLLGPGTPTP